MSSMKFLLAAVAIGLIAADVTLTACPAIPANANSPLDKSPLTPGAFTTAACSSWTPKDTALVTGGYNYIADYFSVPTTTHYVNGLGFVGGLADGASSIPSEASPVLLQLYNLTQAGLIGSQPLASCNVTTASANNTDGTAATYYCSFGYTVALPVSTGPSGLNYMIVAPATTDVVQFFSTGAGNTPNAAMAAFAFKTFPNLAAAGNTKDPAPNGYAFFFINTNCGNGVIDAGEDCDNTNITATNCSAISNAFGSGVATACTPTCTFDFTPCAISTSGAANNGTPSEVVVIGNTATLEYKLPAKPTANVIVVFTIGGGATGSVFPPTAEFTPDNWDTPIPLTISITSSTDKKASVQGGTASLIQSFTSADPKYNGKVATILLVLASPGVTTAGGQGAATNAAINPVFGLSDINTETIETQGVINANGGNANPLTFSTADAFRGSGAAGIVYAALGSMFGLLLVVAVVSAILFGRRKRV